MDKGKSNLVVLSSPSGGGKTTIAKALVSRNPLYRISVSATTRKPRPGECDGTDYHFITPEEFSRRVNTREFLEYEEVHGYYYGTLKSEVEKLLKDGYTVIFDIDVFGALHLKKQFPDAILIFIRPPSLEELVIRLRNRRTDNEDEINKRLQRLPQEYDKAGLFDYDLVNNNLEDTISDIQKIISEN